MFLLQTKRNYITHVNDVFGKPNRLLQQIDDNRVSPNTINPLELYCKTVGGSFGLRVLELFYIGGEGGRLDEKLCFITLRKGYKQALKCVQGMVRE